MMRPVAFIFAVLVLGACNADAVVPHGDGGGVHARPSDGPRPDDASLLDARAVPDGSPADAKPPASRCRATATRISCAARITTLVVTTLVSRRVHWQVPAGSAPALGWPAVLAFQGTAVPAATMWTGDRGAAFGGYHQTAVIKMLLDAGYAVLTPETHLRGTTFWDTNIVPYSTAWTTSPDHRFVVAILDAMKAGRFMRIDMKRLNATGISSGGYMTSRMAVAYPGRFRALAIMAASYATCAGPLCALPKTLPASHPPTLFLHGERDRIVPIATMRPYEAKLRAQRTPTRVVVDAAAGHAWIAAAPAAITAWFRSHR